MILKPRFVLCSGMSFRAHNEEVSKEFSSVAQAYRLGIPTYFIKSPSAICHHGDPVVLPDVTRYMPGVEFDPPYGQVTGEVELAIIFGRPLSQATPEQVMDAVAGFAVFNDVSQRDMQKIGYPHSHSKSFPTFAPLGPRFVPKAEAPNVRSAAYELRVNGTPRQSGTLAEMLFSFEQIVSHASYAFAFSEGDVITTGSPAGLFGYHLAPGDVMEAEIEGIGLLRNPVVGGAR